jgi:hypothetical protein
LARPLLRATLSRAKRASRTPEPTPVSSLWQLYNLRESPFFQEQLTADPEARYPIDLFVGRRAEVDRLVRGIRGKLGSSSRQTVQGRPGIGKSTLIQQIKHVIARDRILSSPLAVRVGHADSTETVLLRIVSYTYAAVLSNSPTTAIADLEPMVTAKQLTLAFQSRSGGVGLNVAGIGGLNAAASTQFITPAAALGVLVPNLLRELLRVVRETLRAQGVLVHLNNLEQLSGDDERRAALILRDIRDDVLLEPGLHFLLAGTTDAIRHVITEHEQLRSVFRLPRPLSPLGLDEVRELLQRRYEHLKADRRKPAIAPVEDPALATLYEVFEGDLRGLLTALEYASESLIELGASGGEPMRLPDIRLVLRARYLEGVEANLRESEAALLAQAAERFPNRPFTQTDLQKLPSKPSKGFVSETVGALRRAGYVLEAEAAAPQRRGRPAVRYVLSPVTRLAFGASQDSAVPLPR